MSQEPESQEPESQEPESQEAGSRQVAPRQLGLRERKRTETRRAIAEAAVRLVSDDGIAATTAERIAAEAGVSRATFFRYFESKELAIATGLTEIAIYVLVQHIRDAPAQLGPLDAIQAAHDELARDFEPNRAMFLEQSLLSRSSAAMTAWTLHLYVDFERAIAEAVAPRITDPVPDDPRPAMVGAATMAATRLACDAWVATEGHGDLPALLRRHLDVFELRPPR